MMEQRRERHSKASKSEVESRWRVNLPLKNKIAMVALTRELKRGRGLIKRVAVRRS